MHRLLVVVELLHDLSEQGYCCETGLLGEDDNKLADSASDVRINLSHVVLTEVGQSNQAADFQFTEVCVYQFLLSLSGTLGLAASSDTGFVLTWPAFVIESVGASQGCVSL